MNIIDKIDKYLLNREHTSSGNHHPSGATKCIRQQYYARTKIVEESNPITPGALWKMEMGNAIHSMLTDFLRNSGLYVRDEISFKKKLDGLKNPISGRIDNLFQENGATTGIEIKTSYGRGVMNLQKSGQPKEDALIQVALYLWCTNVTKFYILYVGRDNAYRCQFLVEKDKSGSILLEGKDTGLTFNNVCKKFFDLEKALDKQILPDREFKAAIKNGEVKDYFQKKGVKYKTDWQCTYCNYKDVCWKSECEKYKEGDNCE